MSKLVAWARCSLATMVWIAVAVEVVGHCAEPAKANRSQTLWDSANLRKVEKEWQSLWDAYDNSPDIVPGDCGKNKNIELQRMVNRLFSRRFSEANLRELAASCDTLPARVGASGFSRDLLAFLVKAFAERGERETLVSLLATRCPDHIDRPVTIEYYLVWRASRLRDPILILGEAYAKSEVPETRHALAAAVRRGFVDLGIRGKDDGEYVGNAMKWYETARDHIVVNHKYVKNELMSSFGVDDYERSPELYDNPNGFARYSLFEQKVSVRESGSCDQRTERNAGKPAGNLSGSESAEPARSATIERDPAKLAGAWEAIAMLDDGNALPAEKLKGVRFVFSGETLRWTVPEERTEEQFRVRFPADQGAGAIDLLWKPKDALTKEQTTPLIYELQESTTLGIFELKGDTLRICLAEPDVSARPTSFKADAGSRETAYVLKRAEKHSFISLIVVSAVAVGAVGVLVRRFVRRRGPRAAAATADAAQRPAPSQPCETAR